MMIKTPAKAPSNEKELEEFLRRLEVEIKMSRIKKRERIARKFRKYLEMQAIEHEIDISDKNPSLIINDYNTFCFACKRKYSFKEVLEALGIKLPLIETDNPEILKHIKLNQVLEEYCEISHNRLTELLNKSSYSYIKDYLLKKKEDRKKDYRKRRYRSFNKR